MYEAFRSHCEQDYDAQYEIVFGVNAADDEAVPFVERLRSEFANLEIKLVVGKEVLGANRKVSNLVQMLAAAQYPHILINDSDILVPRDYLREVMACFSDPRVGMVTCLYHARAGKGIWSKLEALGVLGDFMPGALTARMLEGKVRFGLGSTMAIDRQVLQAIGGLQPLANHLADDYELGSRICDSGHRVVVPRVVVETSTPDYSFRDFWRHQLRWGRTVRSSRPGGYLGVVMTFALLWSVITLLVSGAARPGSASCLVVSGPRSDLARCVVVLAGREHDLLARGRIHIAQRDPCAPRSLTHGFSRTRIFDWSGWHRLRRVRGFLDRITRWRTRRHRVATQNLRRQRFLRLTT
jgi:ceramide glucosyltransferase